MGQNPRCGLFTDTARRFLAGRNGLSTGHTDEVGGRPLDAYAEPWESEWRRVPAGVETLAIRHPAHYHSSDMLIGVKIYTRTSYWAGSAD